MSENCIIMKKHKSEFTNSGLFGTLAVDNCIFQYFAEKFEKIY